MSKVNYLITGGSGFLGINLIRYLLKRNCRIRSLDIAQFNYPEKNRIEIILGDIRDKKTVAEALKNIDIVVHCAAALPLYPKEDILSTGIKGTKILLEESLKQKIKRFIHISSTAVYGVPNHHPIYETDPLSGVGPYGHAKIAAEKLCLDFHKKGLCISILRPKSFVGPERLGVFALLYNWAQSGKNFPIVGSGQNHYQLLDVEDVCQAIYLCGTKDKAKVNGEIFNIATNEFTTIRKDFQSVLDEAGFNKKIISLPAAPIIFFLKILEFFKLSPLYQWIYDTVDKDSYVSIEKAQKILGFKPRYSNKQALLRNYKWYLKNLSKIKDRSGVSHRLPWKQGAISLAKAFF